MCFGAEQYPGKSEDLRLLMFVTKNTKILYLCHTPLGKLIFSNGYFVNQSHKFFCRESSLHFLANSRQYSNWILWEVRKSGRFRFDGRISGRLLWMQDINSHETVIIHTRFLLFVFHLREHAGKNGTQMRLCTWQCNVEDSTVKSRKNYCTFNWFTRKVWRLWVLWPFSNSKLIGLWSLI